MSEKTSEEQAAGPSLTPEGDSLPSGRWRRTATTVAEGFIWRMARRNALRGSKRDEPVAVMKSLNEGRSILAIASEGLPGLLAALPAVRALRRLRRETRLDLLCSPAGQTLLAPGALVDHILGIHPLPPLWRWSTFRRAAQHVASRSYEVVFSFDHRRSRRVVLLCQLSGARLRVQCGEGEGSPFFNVQLVPRDMGRYLPERNLALMATLGIDVSGVNDSWDIAPREAEVAERLLQVKQLKGNRPLIAFDPDPGMDESTSSVAAMTRLAEAVERKTGARGILLSETIQRELPTVGSTSGETRELGLSGLREALGVLSRCDGFVGRNTTFFHFAVAMHVPAVGLFPGDVPAYWRPDDRPGVKVLDAGAGAEENARRAAEHLSSYWEPSLSGDRC